MTIYKFLNPKADVDHLGLLLACGLKDERFTVSRLATLSRQLNSYFVVLDM